MCNGRACSCGQGEPTPTLVPLPFGVRLLNNNGHIKRKKIARFFEFRDPDFVQEWIISNILK
jgi:hypothetical protein